jgi:hypothetical protein
LKTDSIYANSSAGMYLLTNSGAAVAHWGGGGSVEVDFKGFAGYDANRSSSYTARSFTDKGYVDSGLTARLLGYVTLGTVQTITASKTFSAATLYGQTAFFTGSFNSSQVTDPAIFIDRSITGGPSSAHGVEDYSLFNQGDGTSGYAAFFAKPSLEGSRNYDHVRGFQSYPIMNTSGGVQGVESFYSVPTLSQGVVNRLAHFYAGNPSVGTGAVNFHYGLLLDPITVGATKNWGVFSNGTMPNYFGGRVQIGDSVSFSSFYPLQVKGSAWLKDASVFHVIESTGAGNNAEVQFKSTARTWDIGLNISYANNSFELYDRTNAKSAFISTSERRFIIDSAFDNSVDKLQVNGDTRTYGNMTANKYISAAASTSVTGGSTTYIGTGASTTIDGNDVTGTITLITGTGCGSTGASNRSALTVTFATAYANTPIVHIQAIQQGGLNTTDGPSTNFFLRRDAVSSTTFTVYLPIGITLTDSTTYLITYQIFGK